MQKIQERSPRAATRSLASTIRELDAKVLPPWEPQGAAVVGWIQLPTRGEVQA